MEDLTVYPPSPDIEPDYVAAYWRHCYVKNLTTGTVETVSSQAQAEQRRDAIEAAGQRARIDNARHQKVYETPED